MVASAPQPGVDVARRVVQLRIDHVHQRGDLREALFQVVEQGADAGAVLFAEDDDHHHLSCGGGAYHQVAQQPAVFADVVETVSLLQTEPFGLEPDLVRRSRLQPAFADVEHLVELAGDVEAQGGARLDVAATGDLFVGHPAARSEGEFEFVAVAYRLRRADDGRERRKRHLAYPGGRPVECM